MSVCVWCLCWLFIGIYYLYVAPTHNECGYIQSFPFFHIIIVSAYVFLYYPCPIDTPLYKEMAFVKHSESD